MAYEIGGRADKYGNRFETNWTIRKLLEVISYCINAVAPNDSAVLILDQLDALRWTQAHSSDALTICIAMKVQ